MPPAVIAAGVTAAAAIGGAAMSSSAQKKAAKSAANTATQTTNANNALARETYSKNQANLNPWMQQGLSANALINSALGIPMAPQASAFAPPQNYAAPQSYGQMSAFDRYAGQEPGLNEWMGADYGMPQQYGAPVAAQTQAPAPNPQSAFDIFRSSTGYNFRLGEGVNALQKAFGRNLDSGAAVKSALRFGQGIGSAEFGNWLGALGNQQQLGWGAANALAGQNSNLSNTLMQNNNQGASVAINAMGARGDANARMWQGIGSSLGQFAGSFGGQTPAFGGGVPRDQYGVSPWLYGR